MLNLDNKLLHEIINDITFSLEKYGTESLAKVISDLKKNGSFAEGAIFVLDILKKFPDQFPKGKTFFEYNVAHGRIDVFVQEGGQRILYEMKNVENILMDNFGSQVFRDLEAAESLSNINWFFNGRKLVGQQAFSEAQKTEMLGDITAELLTKTVPQMEALYAKFLDPINDPQSLNTLINKISLNFDQIFKIVN
jgi:hypothetical protein